MTPEEARDALAAAVRTRNEAKAAWDESRDRLYGAIREASAVLRQVDIVRATGYTRERVRQIALDAANSDTPKSG